MPWTDQDSPSPNADENGGSDNRAAKAGRRPRLLYLLHCYHNRAGTEEHTRTLAAALADEFEISIAYPENGSIYLMREGRSQLEFPGAPVPWPLAPLRSTVIEKSLARLLEAAKPQIVHIQHLHNWPLSTLDQLAASGIPLVMTFHDYFTITPHWTMERTADPRDTTSLSYSKTIFRSDISEYLKQRRAVLERSLARVSHFLAPSMFAAREISKVFPLAFQVIEHGIAPITAEKAPGDGRTLRFGFVGSLLPQKGWLSLLNGFSEVRSQCSDIELHFYGGGQEFQGREPAGVKFHGVYEQPDLPRILGAIDVGIIPSVFRETFSLVLSELWMAGLPVAVSNIGALGERVVDHQNGIKFPAGDITAIADALRWFYTDNSWRNWTIPRPREIPAMIAEYRALYRQVLERTS